MKQRFLAFATAALLLLGTLPGSAVASLVRPDGFPDGALAGLTWRRDFLGKPYVEWSGAAAE